MKRRNTWKGRSLSVLLSLAMVCTSVNMPGFGIAVRAAELENSLICEQTEHTHGEGCYLVGNLLCGQEETEEHTHSDDCYGEPQLTCELEEHTHTEECYAVNDETETTEAQNESVEETVSENETKEETTESETITAFVTSMTVFIDKAKEYGWSTDLSEEEAQTWKESIGNLSEEQYEEFLTLSDTAFTSYDNLTDKDMEIVGEEGEYADLLAEATEIMQVLSSEATTLALAEATEIMQVLSSEATTLATDTVSLLAADVCGTHLKDTAGIVYTINEGTTTVTVGSTQKDSGIIGYKNCAMNTLTTVTIPESIVYQGKTYTVTAIGRAAFCGVNDSGVITVSTTVKNTSLQKITLPQTVTSIEYSAFYNCTALTSVTMPGVEIIGRQAFARCAALQNITFPDSLSTIEQQAFQYCTTFTSVTLPNSLTTLGTQVFFNCISLASVQLPTNSSFTTIGNWTFMGTALSMVTVPANVTTIGGSAFISDSLKTVYLLGNSVKTFTPDDNAKGYPAFAAKDRLTVSNIKVYVPCSLVQSYANSSTIDGGIEAGWKAYAASSLYMVHDHSLPGGQGGVAATCTQKGMNAGFYCSTENKGYATSSVTSSGSKTPINDTTTNNITKYGAAQASPIAAKGHNWQYTVSSQGNVITATCNNSPEEHPANVTYTLNATSPVTYNASNVYNGVSGTDNITNTTGTTLSGFTYYTNSACTATYKTTTANGATSIGGAPKNAGTYWVTNSVMSGSTVKATAKASFTINPISKIVTEPTAKTEIIYSGSAQNLLQSTASITGLTSSDYSVSYKVVDANDNVVSDWGTTYQASALGNYKVYYKVNLTNNNYTVDTKYTDGSQFVAASIEKAAPVVVTAPTAKNSTYNGDNQVLLSTGSVTGGHFEYSVGTASAAGTSWSESIPEKKTADTYYVWYKVVGDSNHKNLDPIKISVTISKATVGIDWSAEEFTYNKGVQAPTATATGIYDTDEVNITVTGGQINAGTGYTAEASALTGADANNYQLPADTSIINKTFDIKPATVTISFGNTEFIYNATSQQPTATVNGLFDGDSCTATVTGGEINANTESQPSYTATVAKASGLSNANYTLENDATTTFTIAPKPLTEGMVALNSTGGTGNAYTHTGGTISPVVTVTDGTILSAGSDYTISGDTSGTAFGTYTLTVTGKGNYKDTISVSWKITDPNPPTAKITVSNNEWNTFLNNITFGVFFKETQTVTISGADGAGESGLDKIYYFTSENVLTEADVKAKTAGDWTELSLDESGTGNFNINPDEKLVIYAKITDKSGNATFISSTGIVLDATAPVITGVTDGKGYCSLQTITVSDENLKEVTVDGTAITLNADGTYQLQEKEEAQIIKAVDKAGNETTVTVIIHANHRWGEWVIDREATATTEGKKHKECSVDRQMITETIPKTGESDDSGLGDGAGAINKETVVHDDAPFTTLNTSKKELVESNILTTEQKTAIQNGNANATIYLEVDGIATPNGGADAVTKFEGKATELTGSSANLTYLDISLWLRFEHKTDTTKNVEEKVSTVDKPISVTITLPDSLINKDSSKVRTYYILRVHGDGDCELVGSGNADAHGEFTFTTNKFSDYAITYKDEAKPVVPGSGSGDGSGGGSGSDSGSGSGSGVTPPTNNTVPSDNATPTDNMNPTNNTQPSDSNQNSDRKNPKTGDDFDSRTWIYLMMLGLAGVGGTFVYRKKKKREEQ